MMGIVVLAALAVCLLAVACSSQTVTHIGCYVDGWTRDLPDRLWESDEMTVQACISHCQGYNYAGVQNSNQCFCGNSYGSHGADAAGCTSECTGDSSVICGAFWRNSIYELRSVAAVTYSQVGCFQDSWSRDLPHNLWEGDVTPDRCAVHCAGFDYFSTQNGNHCFCGNSYGTHGTAGAGDCTTDCRGDNSQDCGGWWRNMVYQLDAAIPPMMNSLGCFVDSGRRDLSGKMYQHGANTPQVCVAFCRGYNYAGVQNGEQCFCGNTYNSYGSDPGVCNNQCTGDNGQHCGAWWRNEIYQIRTVRSTPVTFIGCYVDEGSRDLNNRFWQYDGMTQQLCANHCQGYRYMGVQNGNQCFCGNDYGSYGEDAGGCTTNCGGMQSDNCGALWRNAVYSLDGSADCSINNGGCAQICDSGDGSCSCRAGFQLHANGMACEATDASIATYVGCFIDAGDRDLPHRLWESNELTAEACQGHCEGYNYAGLQNANQCFCGNSYGKHGSDHGACTSECTGDSSEICGAFWRNSIYQLRPVTPVTYTRIGCYVDSWNRDLPHHLWEGDVTAERCARHCAGFQYFGTQNGNQCYCGNSYGTHGPDGGGCNTDCRGDNTEICGGWWRNTVYELDAGPVQAVSDIGCFIDSHRRDLSGKMYQHNDNTPQLCQAFCRGYNYAGVQNGEQCFCGNNYGSYGTDNNCETVCTGDSGQSCGAWWRNYIYQIRPVRQADLNFIGCYVDKGSRDLNNRFWQYNGMTRQLCANHCRGFSFMGVQNGNQCFCGNDYGSYGEDAGACTTDCGGNQAENCGAFWRNAVYGVGGFTADCAFNNGGCAGACSSVGGVAICTCEDGLVLGADGITCEDFDECSDGNGGCDHFCDNTVGDFACRCQPGYQLNANGFTCDDIDQCATDNGGCEQTCVNIPGLYTCGCTAGYILAANGVTCDNVNECAADNGGCEQICNDSDGTFSCDCSDGFALDTDGSSCLASDPCLGNGGCQHTCVPTGSIRHCTCNSGYTLADNGLTCYDTDECATDNGGCDQICDNVDASFTCGCTAGFTLAADGTTCDSISGCDVNNGGCEQFCHEENGSSYCSCDEEESSLNIDGVTCDPFPEDPESMFMLQALSGERTRFCFNVTLDGVTHLRLIHDPDHEITVNAQVVAASEPAGAYFSHVSYHVRGIFIVFSYNDVTVDGTSYTWSNLPARYNGLDIVNVRDNEAVTIRTRTPRRQVVILFDKSVAPYSGAERVEATIFRWTGLSDPIEGVIGSRFRYNFMPIGDGARTPYGISSSLNTADGVRDCISVRRHNSRNNRNMQCWKTSDGLTLDDDNIVDAL